MVYSLGALLQRVPKADWKPEGYVESEDSDQQKKIGNVTVEQSMRTPQFYLIW